MIYLLRIYLTMLMQEIDEDLNLLRSFNDENFEVIFRKYYPGLLLFVERHVGDRDLAKDIVQDVFFKLYENSAKLPDGLNVKSWLYKVSRNAAIDYIRHLKVIDNNHLLMAESMIFAGEIDEVINEELACKINRAVDSLPEQCRQVVYMSVIEGKKYTEIAQGLELSINTVRTQISRGYKKLRKILAKEIDSLTLLFYMYRKEFV